MRTAIKTPGLGDSTAYGYEQCIRVGNLVFVAGQAGVDETYKVVSEDFTPQAEQTFKNVGLALAAAGCGFEDVVSLTVYLTEFERDFEAFLAVRQSIFTNGRLPTEATVGVTRLAFPSLLIEIQAIAVRPEPG